MSEIWIFGYGSLIWRPGFPFLENRPARIDGWARRFWQGSTDHRGVPGAPGRVVTLVEISDEACWGRAFRIDTEFGDKIIGRLNYREKGGYSLREVDMVFRDGSDAKGLVYIALPGNPNWLGEAEVEDIAKQIRGSEGPSGNNPDYVVELAAALREMDAADSHVFEVAALVAGG